MAKKKKKKYDKEVNIRNKRASFEYHLLEQFEAGIQLMGTEIKSIRLGQATLGDGFCLFHRNELFVKGLRISEYEMGNINNHKPLRMRKLLLKKRELKKLERAVKEKGLTIIPIRLFINARGYAKLIISLAKGKKSFDKRQSIKDKDIKRDVDRSGSKYDA